MGISITRMMDSIRILSLKERLATRETTVPTFNRLFLNSVKRHGRVHELGLVIAYNLFSGQPFKDIDKAPQMLYLTGMRLLPMNVNQKAVRRIFSEQDTP
jgi:heterodisulfide reductase subunit C